jgi:hypothetical protein
MFPPTEAIALNRLNVNLIEAGAKGNALSLGDNIIAFANHDFGFALAVAVKTNSHFPTSNPLSFDERVGRYVQVLNTYSLSTPTPRAAPVSLRAAYIRGSGSQHRP